MQNLMNDLTKLLKKDDRIFADGKLLKNKLTELALKLDHDLIELLLSDRKSKEHFFVGKMFKKEKVFVFDKDRFISFVNNKEFLPDSFTSFRNKIGLMSNGDYLREKGEVVLVWPYKDCVLEGGQRKEDQKRDEIFYNEILAPDEIDRLFEPKVLTSFKKYDGKGKHKVNNFSDKDNLIIKGNNLLALHCLKYKYRGKIDLIYIDPPYNTETDSFKYNDKFNHSTWLTFMSNRLEIARELLSTNGVIFVQCDDYEQAYLKVLMDEVFGRNEFVGVLVWQRAKGGGQAKEIVRGHDYILVYKNFAESVTLKREKSIQKQIVEINGIEYIKNDDFIRKVFGKYSAHKTENFDRRCFYEEIEKIKGAEKKKEIDGKIKSGECLLEKHPSGKHIVCRLEPLNTAYSTFYSIIKNISDEGNQVIKGYLSEAGKYDLEKTGVSGFDYPKPVGLIKVLIKSIMMHEQEGIILDFFSGSGTTAQAVLELNMEDKGNRQFILCEQLDYVDTITVPRVQKAIKATKKGSFIYLTLKEWNEEYMNEVRKADTRSKLLKICKKIKKDAFFRYDIDLSKFDEKEFEKLAFKEQKQILRECLDKNHLYVNLSEIDDSTYKISAEDKKLSKEFYKATV